MGKTASSYAPTTVDVRSLRSSQGANLRHEESGFWPQGSGPSRSQGSSTNLPPATTSSATTSNAKAQDAWRVPSRIYREQRIQPAVYNGEQLATETRLRQARGDGSPISPCSYAGSLQ